MPADYLVGLIMPRSIFYIPASCRVTFLGVVSTAILLCPMLAAAVYADDAETRIELRQPLVRHPDRTDLSFPAPGRLYSIDVEEGSIVTEGQLLAALNYDQEKAQLNLRQAQSLAMEMLETAKVRRAAAENVLKSSKEANRMLARAIPIQELLKLELDLELAQAELKEREYEKRIAQLEMLVAKSAYDARFMHAPSAGTITRRYVSVGASVDATKPVVQIVNTSKIRVEGYVSLAEARLLKLGEKLTVKQKNNQEHVLALGFVDIGAQQVQKLVRIWAQMESTGQLLEGEPVDAWIILPSESSSTATQN